MRNVYALQVNYKEFVRAFVDRLSKQQSTGKDRTKSSTD